MRQYVLDGAGKVFFLVPSCSMGMGSPTGRQSRLAGSGQVESGTSFYAHKTFEGEQ